MVVTHARFNGRLLTIRHPRPGAIVPLPRGLMRNIWFPTGTADYVTMPELQKLRLTNAAVERDFNFGQDLGTKGSKSDPTAPWKDDIPGDNKNMSTDEVVDASAFQKKMPLGLLTAEQSIALVERFVRPRLEFYRQPIIEEVQEEVVAAPAPKKRASYGSGAGAELLAARLGGAVPPTIAKAVDGPQAIYGSVSPLDVLQAVRATLAEDDEAKRVVLAEQDVQFVDLPESEGEAAKVVKHVGEFAVEIRLKGAERAVRRVVAVVAQEL